MLSGPQQAAHKTREHDVRAAAKQRKRSQIDHTEWLSVTQGGPCHYVPVVTKAAAAELAMSWSPETLHCDTHPSTKAPGAQGYTVHVRKA